MSERKRAGGVRAFGAGLLELDPADQRKESAPPKPGTVSKRWQAPCTRETIQRLIRRVQEL